MSQAMPIKAPRRLPRERRLTLVGGFELLKEWGEPSLYDVVMPDVVSFAIGKNQVIWVFELRF